TRWFLLLCLFAPTLVRADGTGDNLPNQVRRIPPAGVAVPAADRTELEDGVRQLGIAIEELRAGLKGAPALLDLLPDVQIYHNAVRYALQYDEFFNARDPRREDPASARHGAG